jgi:hypothetical protein
MYLQTLKQRQIAKQAGCKFFNLVEVQVSELQTQRARFLSETHCDEKNVHRQKTNIHIDKIQKKKKEIHPLCVRRERERVHVCAPSWLSTTFTDTERHTQQRIDRQMQNANVGAQ